MAFSGSNTKLIVNNRLPDALFEQNVSSVLTFDDGASATPTDLTGGTASAISVSRNTSSPLHGSADLLITRAAANAQGEGAAIAFSLDNGDQTQVMEVSFSYKTSANYADNDLVLWLYDVTNAVLIQPAEGYQLKADLVAGRHRAIFQASSNSTSYRLGFFCPVTSSTAWTVEVDNLAVRPAEYQGASPGFDSVAFTPTGTWTTNTTYSGFYSRQGEFASARVKVATTGAPTATNLFVNLPFTIDTSKLHPDALTQPLGYGIMHDQSSGTRFGVKVSYNTSTQVALRYDQNASFDDAGVASTLPWTWANGDLIEFVISEVPVVGWAATTLSSNQADQRLCTFKIDDTVVTPTSAAFNGSTALIFNGTPLKDTHAGYSTSTGRYTVPTSGDYRVVGRGAINANLTTGDKVGIEVYKNSTQVASGQTRVPASVTQTIFVDVDTILPNCVAGDTIELRLRTAGTSPAISVDGAGSYSFEVEKVQGPSSITSTELVSARYVNTAGTSIPNLSLTLVPFATKDFDTHSAFSTPDYTVPVTGKYLVQASITWVGNSTGTRVMVIGKNTATHSRTEAQGATPNSQTLATSSIINCVAGDTIQVYAFQGSGGALSLDSSTGANYLAVTRIGI